MEIHMPLNQQIDLFSYTANPSNDTPISLGAHTAYRTINTVPQAAPVGLS